MCAVTQLHRNTFLLNGHKLHLYYCINVLKSRAQAVRLYIDLSDVCGSWSHGIDCIKGCLSPVVICARLRLCCTALKSKCIIRVRSHVGRHRGTKLFIQIIAENKVWKGICYM